MGHVIMNDKRVLPDFNISDSFTRIAMTLNDRLLKTLHFVEIYQCAILLEGTLFVQSMNHNSSTFSTTLKFSIVQRRLKCVLHKPRKILPKISL